VGTSINLNARHKLSKSSIEGEIAMVLRHSGLQLEICFAMHYLIFVLFCSFLFFMSLRLVIKYQVAQSQ